jgi:hypothetical protein
MFNYALYQRYILINSMYFIKQVSVNEKIYQYSKIIDHTRGDFLEAQKLLEKTVKLFVKNEWGREAIDNKKIIDIQQLEEIVEPVIDCVLLYRLINDPTKIYVYQKKTNITKKFSYYYGTTDTLVPKFCLINIFELEEYNNLICDTKIETVESQVPKIEISKQVSNQLRINLLNELKQNPRFKHRSDSQEQIPKFVTIIEQYSNP